MARFKKRSNMNDGMGGLFDSLGDSLFPEIAPLPTAPVIEKAAKKHLEEIQRRRTDMFAGDDGAFAPLDVIPGINKLSFISFGSGSSGNCAYIGDAETGLLIDAGVDYTSVVNELKRVGIGMDRVKGILLTHDHSDHVRYVYAFVRKYRHIGVYCTPRTLNGMLRRHSISNRIKDYHRPIYKEHPFKIGSFEIVAFDVLHDGTDNAGFFISRGNHHITVATDLGCISERADYYLRQANYMMIEANYDDEMLASGPYPEYLKARIRSDNGHLDNVVTADYLGRIYTPQLRQIFLCHLSKDNNRPEKAFNAVESALLAAGVKQVGDGSETPYARMAPVQLRALPRFDSTGLITLRLD